MKNQICFLLLLGAFENHHFALNKCGIVSDLLAYPENEKLWLEAKNPLPLTNYIYATINEIGSDCLEVSIDGTLFPSDFSKFEKIFKKVIYVTCEEIELNISFDGFHYEEALEISKNKEQMMNKLKNGQLEFSYLTHIEENRICVLTEEQVQKLAILSVDFDIYSYFDSVKLNGGIMHVGE